ncbi:MAG: methyl-accepting chemotaxis protein [Xanthobacteraceae bacterium]|nr:methyl-accepting chemotaxis protein [Xanthobacteraceae bacterium]
MSLRRLSFVRSPFRFVLLPFRAVRRLVPELTVRGRVIALAIVPLIGFGAIGATYLSGEQAVQGAFGETKAGLDLSKTSAALKTAVVTMRESAKDFVMSPGSSAQQQFEGAYRAAVERAAEIGARDGSAQVKELLDRIKGDLGNVKDLFERLVKAQAATGVNIVSGARGELHSAGQSFEKALEEAASMLTGEQLAGLRATFLGMRVQEKELLLARTRESLARLQEDQKRFVEQVQTMFLPDEDKAKLVETSQVYAAAAKTYGDAAAPLQLFLNMIINALGDLGPVADEIVAAASTRHDQATASFEASQARTKALIMGVGVAAILLGIALALLIGRSITGPLKGLAGAMERLAAGDISVDIPATEAKDEIGAMARTVIVFRDNAIEREQLAVTQEKGTRERERRAETIARTITAFEQSVGQTLTQVRGAAERLESAAGALNGAADAVSTEARAAEERVGAASGNVTSAAGSAEELAASIGEIASQAATSTQVAGRAVQEAQRTVKTMTELGSAASRIGEVIGLIQAIAGQTNLLALNATIEAARAGEAGRGFAVVASEVKNLAGQTAKATEEVAAQIGAIQSAAGDAAEAIEQVNAIIEEMSKIAASVAAAVEEQNAAVASIAEGVNRASSEARTGAEAMSRVAGASSDARSTADDVKDLAGALSSEAENLDGEVRRFLDEVRAA